MDKIRAKVKKLGKIVKLFVINKAEIHESYKLIFRIKNCH